MKLNCDMNMNEMYRVGPDSPFALLSPVLGSEIPFERGFLGNRKTPSL